MDLDRNLAPGTFEFYFGGVSMVAAILQFIPLMTIQVVYAVIVFMMAKRRKLSPWPWTIGSLVPGIGMIVSGIFILLTIFSVLDRLNALESKATFS